MSAAWRLILDGPVPGARNMALDRAVQLQVDAGESQPTLRLYQWARPTVSLGRFQDPKGVDVAYCEARGIDIVRRATGGRGVLHDDELTYAVIARTVDGIPRGTAASYRYLCAALVTAYRELGVGADLTARARGEGSSAACYLHATQADLSLGVLKLSGSAQVWHRDTVLQHGSFARTRDVDREASVFRLGATEARRLAEQTATLGDVLKLVPSIDAIAGAVETGVSRALGVTLRRGGYTEAELTSAVQLEAMARVEP